MYSTSKELCLASRDNDVSMPGTVMHVGLCIRAPDNAFRELRAGCLAPFSVMHLCKK
jgi:hypothetical protein